MPPRPLRRSPDVDAYIARQPPPHRAILRAIRRLVHRADPEAREAIHWGVPFFFHETGPLVYASAAKAHVTLGFTLAGRIEDPSGRLEGTGKSDIRKTVLRPGEDVPEALVLDWTRRSVAAWEAEEGG